MGDAAEAKFTGWMGAQVTSVDKKTRKVTGITAMTASYDSIDVSADPLALASFRPVRPRDVIEAHHDGKFQRATIAELDRDRGKVVVTIHGTGETARVTPESIREYTPPRAIGSVSTIFCQGAWTPGAKVCFVHPDCTYAYTVTVDGQEFVQRFVDEADIMPVEGSDCTVRLGEGEGWHKAKIVRSAGNTTMDSNGCGLEVELYDDDTTTHANSGVATIADDSSSHRNDSDAVSSAVTERRRRVVTVTELQVQGRVTAPVAELYRAEVRKSRQFGSMLELSRAVFDRIWSLPEAMRLPEALGRTHRELVEKAFDGILNGVASFRGGLLSSPDAEASASPEVFRQCLLDAALFAEAPLFEQGFWLRTGSLFASPAMSDAEISARLSVARARREIELVISQPKYKAREFNEKIKLIIARSKMDAAAPPPDSLPRALMLHSILDVRIKDIEPATLDAVVASDVDAVRTEWVNSSESSSREAGGAKYLALHLLLKRANEVELSDEALCALARPLLDAFPEASIRKTDGGWTPMLLVTSVKSLVSGVVPARPTLIAELARVASKAATAAALPAGELCVAVPLPRKPPSAIADTTNTGSSSAMVVSGTAVQQRECSGWCQGRRLSEGTALFREILELDVQVMSSCHTDDKSSWSATRVLAMPHG